MKSEAHRNKVLIEPRFSEVDMMKVVHHSKYIVWFEESRFRFLKDILDISIEEFKQMELFMPVVDCHVQYKRSVWWGDHVYVETRLEISQKANCRLHYVVTNAANGKVCTLGTTEHVFIDHDFKLKLVTPAIFNERVKKYKDLFPYAFISAS